MSTRTLSLTLGIFWGAAMFFLAWWLIFTGNDEGPITLLERIWVYKLVRSHKDAAGIAERLK